MTCHSADNRNSHAITDFATTNQQDSLESRSSATSNVGYFPYHYSNNSNSQSDFHDFIHPLHCGCAFDCSNSYCCFSDNLDSQGEEEHTADSDVASAIAINGITTITNDKQVLPTIAIISKVAIIGTVIAVIFYGAAIVGCCCCCCCMVVVISMVIAVMHTNGLIIIESEFNANQEDVIRVVVIMTTNFRLIRA